MKRDARFQKTLKSKQPSFLLTEQRLIQQQAKSTFELI